MVPGRYDYKLGGIMGVDFDMHSMQWRSQGHFSRGEWQRINQSINQSSCFPAEVEFLFLSYSY